VGEIKGFKKNGRAITLTTEGRTLLETFKKVIMFEVADIRKALATATPKDFLASMPGMDAFFDPSAVIRPADKAQFDYDQEVKAARAAYPRLRKALEMSDSLQLPGETK
jgi:hypothetical protein